jgi:hypothetical protein
MKGFFYSKNITKSLSSILLVLSALGFYTPEVFGQCNPSGNASRFEFNL